MSNYLHWRNQFITIYVSIKCKLIEYKIRCELTHNVNEMHQTYMGITILNTPNNIKASMFNEHVPPDQFSKTPAKINDNASKKLFPRPVPLVFMYFLCREQPNNSTIQEKQQYPVRGIYAKNYETRFLFFIGILLRESCLALSFRAQ